MESLGIPWDPLPGGVLFDTTLLGLRVSRLATAEFGINRWAPDPVHRGVAGLALHGSVAARVLRARQWTVFGVHMVDPSLAIRINVDQYGSTWI